MFFFTEAEARIVFDRDKNVFQKFGVEDNE